MAYHRPKRPLTVPGSQDDREGMENQQAAGARCTCTGGPYTHGPEGLAKALREIADAQQLKQAPEQPAEEGGADHD